MSIPHGSIWQKLFGNSAHAFGTLSVALLIALAIAPAKSRFSEWRSYQHGYRNMVHGRADGNTLERRMEAGVQQIWLPEQGVVDRCTTCHVGLREASLSDGPTQPFRRHPPIPHSLTEFGCVTCHRGQGAATTVEEAHSTTKAWEQPLLPARYIESGCGQCHLDRLAGTPHLNAGRDLMARNGCVRCHTVKMPDGSRMTGTDDPPSLQHVADKTTREWIYAWIKDPKAYSSTATMPNFLLSDDDARDISAFIVSQSTPGPQVLKAVAGKPATAADPAAGTTLYGQSFCASCHAVQNAAGTLVGGDLGPELTRIGTKAKPQWIEQWLRNPGDYDPDTKMPHYRFTDQQIATLSGFLQAKKDDDFVANVHLADATPQQIAHGKQLVNEYGCASCHAINGIKKPENFAPELSRVGSKPFSQLAFPDGVEHTLPEYIAAKVRDPRALQRSKAGAGVALKMPQYKFTTQQIDSITTALLSLTDRAQTQRSMYRVDAHPPTSYRPAGQAGKLIADLRCFSCHAINGRGGDMAPDLTWEGSSVQRAWLQDFLRNPNTLRPALIRRMPKFNLTDGEINTLSDYIMTVYQTPDFDRDTAVTDSSPAAVEQGRQLFYGKYACNSCHIVDTHKDKGYIGPALWSVGNRLNAAWVYHYLQDPQALRPGTLEPNQHIPENDLRALTAFLMAQKAKENTPAKAQLSAPHRIEVAQR